MKTFQNVTGRAVAVPNGPDLAPGETYEAETNRGLAPLLEAGVLVEQEPKKKEGSK